MIGGTLSVLGLIVHVRKGTLGDAIWVRYRLRPVTVILHILISLAAPRPSHR